MERQWTVAQFKLAKNSRKLPLSIKITPAATLRPVVIVTIMESMVTTKITPMQYLNPARQLDWIFFYFFFKQGQFHLSWGTAGSNSEIY